MELTDLFHRVHLYLDHAARARSIAAPLVTAFEASVLAVLVFGCAVAAILAFVWMERFFLRHMRHEEVSGDGATRRWWPYLCRFSVRVLREKDTAAGRADRLVRAAVPLAVFIPVFTVCAAVPFGKGLTAAEPGTGILFILVLSAMSIFGSCLGGISSGDPRYVVRGLSECVCRLSFESLRFLSLVPAVIAASSLRMSLVGSAPWPAWFESAPRWFILYPVVGQVSFVLFFIASLSQIDWSGTAAASADADIVSGYFADYTGFPYAVLLFSRYAAFFLACVLGAVVFLGGGSGPVLPSWLWVMIKTYMLAAVFTWFRISFPRWGRERFEKIVWPVLVPAAGGSIIIAALLRVYIRTS